MISNKKRESYGCGVRRGTQLGPTRTAGSPSLALLGLQVTMKRVRHIPSLCQRPEIMRLARNAENEKRALQGVPVRPPAINSARVIPAQLRPAHTPPPPPVHTRHEPVRFVARPRRGINRTGSRSLARLFPMTSRTQTRGFNRSHLALRLPPRYCPFWRHGGAWSHSLEGFSPRLIAGLSVGLSEHRWWGFGGCQSGIDIIG